MSESLKSFKDVIEEYSLPCLCESNEIFSGVELSKFSPNGLKSLLKDKPLKWRIGKRTTNDLQWESSCATQIATVSQILEWNSITNCQDTTPIQKESQATLGACCQRHYWCYADYMYMNHVFRCREDVVNESLPWKELGFTDKLGVDGTMWVGTAGAHTLCHYDTYGYNIVVQISGSKRWTLFPPSETDSLYPTRIPYEESSVFSEVNITNPDLTQHPKFRNAPACSVVLRAGDILYVPRHWWHYVENLELSVSINLWCDTHTKIDIPTIIGDKFVRLHQEHDAEERLRESVTRLIIGAMVPSITNWNKDWVTPSEDIESVACVEKSLEYLNDSLRNLSTITENAPSPGSNEQQIFRRNGLPITIKPQRLRPFIEGRTGDTMLIAKKRKLSGRGCVTRKDFVKCLTRPNVVSVIAREMRNVTNDPECQS